MKPPSMESPELDCNWSDNWRRYDGETGTRVLFNFWKVDEFDRLLTES